MTNEELNKALLEKLNREKERYVEWLLSQPLDEILNGAYQYYIMNDVILYLEEHNLDDEQAQALLDMESPLYNAFERFEDIPTGHMQTSKSTRSGNKCGNCGRRRYTTIRLTMPGKTGNWKRTAPPKRRTLPAGRRLMVCSPSGSGVRDWTIPPPL